MDELLLDELLVLLEPLDDELPPPEFLVAALLGELLLDALLAFDDELPPLESRLAALLLDELLLDALLALDALLVAERVGFRRGFSAPSTWRDRAA